MATTRSDAAAEKAEVMAEKKMIHSVLKDGATFDGDASNILSGVLTSKWT